MYPGEILPLQIVLGVLALALGNSSPLLGVCMLRTPGVRYASLDVGVYGIVGHRNDDSNDDISCPRAEVTTLGHVAAPLFSINTQSKHT